MSVYQCMVEKRLIKRILDGFKKFFRSCRSYLDYKIAFIMWKSLSKKTKINDNQIMFWTYQDKYTCNPKYLCEELIKSGLDVKLIWVYSKKTGGDLSQFPPEVELVRFGTIDYYKAMASSKVWIDNAHNCSWEAFPKKKEQVFINLWHGSLGLKRIDAESDSHRRRRKAGKRDSIITDYCISNSEFEDMVYKTSYWPNTKILRYGHCRNDLMFSDKDEFVKLKKKVCKKLGIPENKKILLYAPTFRDGNTLDYCDIDYEKLKETLDKKFGGDWIILSRFHFHIVLKFKDKVSQMRSDMDYVIIADDYNDMQELIAIADIGITDYSSWICDFILTGRPGFLFATDVEQYVSERGFYYPLETTPFAVCKSNKELIKAIEAYDEKSYKDKTKEYLDGLGCAEDGHASEKIIDLLKEEIGLK